MKKVVRLVLVLVILSTIGVVAWLTLRHSRAVDDAITASGTVEATTADLGFQLAGRIAYVSVREGDRVEQGEELAALDRSELEAQRRAAEARGASARAMLSELVLGYRSEEVEQARAALRAAREKLEEARRVVERTRRLYEGGAVSKELLDTHETSFEVAKESVAGAEENLRLLETGPRKERIAAQRAAVEQAEADVARIEASLEFALIRAPFAGLITLKHREPGETVPPGAPVLTLMNPDDRWIRIYVREDDVGRLQIGQPVEITADADPSRIYEGRIIFIANEAEFTPRNVQTTEERVKLVYRVKVQITGDPSYDLKSGLAADVRIAEPVQ
jgi:HlyD family secretion protein